MMTPLQRLHCVLRAAIDALESSLPLISDEQQIRVRHVLSVCREECDEVVRDLAEEAA